MRLLTIAALAFLLLASCNQKPASNAGNVALNDTTFTVSGNIAGLDTGKIIFTHRIGDERVYDTTDIKGGTFEFNGKIPPAEGMIAYTCFIRGNDDVRVDMLVENAKIKLTANAGAFDAAVISGSPAQDDFNAFKSLTKDIDSAISNLGKVYTATKDKHIVDSLDKVYDSYDSVKQTLVPVFVNGHTHSVASAYIISRTMLAEPKIALIDPVYNMLDSAVKQSKYGKVVGEVLDALKRTAVGQIAPDFTMNDRDGKPVALSSLRGKYIFVDFWASWCGPCRRENPNVVAAYTKYHSAKFDILGVSLDNKKENWEEAIAKDKLTWLHVSDLKGWGNAAAKSYGIRAIPANLLLDKDGKILARNLFGADLDKKLKEVLQ